MAFSPFTRRHVVNMLGGVSLAGLAGQAQAQVAGGDKNITFIVPFSAGSGPDTIGRLAAQYLQQKWKQTIIVDKGIGDFFHRRTNYKGNFLSKTSNTQWHFMTYHRFP